MTFKNVIIPFHLLLNVAFYVDDNFCVESMHIFANIKPKICIKP